MANLDSKLDAVRHIKALWAGAPEATYCLQILDFIAKHSTAQYLPMNLFLELGGRKDDEVILRAVSYLTGGDLHFLNLNLEFVDEEHSRFLDSDEARAATVHKINPLTGESDSELDSKLFIYFSPTDFALKILA